MKNDAGVQQDATEVVDDQIELLEREIALLPRWFEVLLFHVAAVVVSKTVEACDLMPVGQQPLAQMRTDEARRSGHHNLHCGQGSPFGMVDCKRLLSWKPDETI